MLEALNTMTANEMILIAVIALFCGYYLYAALIETLWGINPRKKTPAVRLNDGNDYSPTSKWMAYAHQFTTITGAGPVTGPVIAAMFGWLPTFLWLVVGSIFFGAMHDFAALYVSIKNEGKSIGLIVEEYIGRTGKIMFLLFSWLFMVLIIAAFVDICAETFEGYTGAAAGSTSIMYTVGAVLFGFYLRRRKPDPIEECVVGFALMVALVWLGMVLPFYAEMATWHTILFGYILLISICPMWLIKQPRDYLSMFLLLGLIVGAVVGVFVINPDINLKPFVGFEVNGFYLFPMLFVTVACGAISGFHGMVSSGTTSKILSNEREMKFVGYGAMITETLLAVIALIVVCYASKDGHVPMGTPFYIFSTTIGSFLMQVFGMPAMTASVVMTVCVSTLAITTVDACGRLARMSFQELFRPPKGVEKTQTQKVLTNPVFATLVTLGVAFVLCQIGYMSIWALFGASNQLMATLTLVAVAVYLKATMRTGFMLYIPIGFMFVVCMTALALSVKGIFGLIQSGDFVWMTHGLQLIIAVALMVLAVMVVYQAVRKLSSR